MIEKKSWEEFRRSGLFWFVNTTLHAFGWALVMEMNELGGIDKVYPARVKFRGFSEEINTDGYKKVAKYMYENGEEINKEANE